MGGGGVFPPSMGGRQSLGPVHSADSGLHSQLHPEECVCTSKAPLGLGAPASGRFPSLSLAVLLYI